MRVLQWASSVYKDMPVYEYRCSDCRKKTAVLVRSFAAETTPACQHCGGSNLSRLISRVASHKSSGGDDFGNDDFGGLDESDPRAMAGMMRRMGAESGEELGPEFEEMVGRMEAGEMPDDLGGGLDGGMGDDDDF